MTKYDPKNVVLTCHHCGVIFEGTPSQRFHWKYEQRPALCSPACQQAAAQERAAAMRKPQAGPCRVCGRMFHSKGSRSRLFCSMACYMKSEQFQVHAAGLRFKVTPEGRARGYAALRTGETQQCLECQGDFWRRAASHRKFCSRSCFRAFMARRFDRWIASPQELALPQGYDEFLEAEELPCIVAGCSWRGQHLSLHVNLAHGFPAPDLKRAAGFNLSSGLVSKPLRQTLCERDNTGVALDDWEGPKPTIYKGPSSGYRSLEGQEHQRKARAVLQDEPGPVRTCEACGAEFQQGYIWGHTRYCSQRCRDAFYSILNALRRYPLTCSTCGVRFLGNTYQAKRETHGSPVVCSLKCRQHLNSSRKQGGHRHVVPN